MKKTIAMIIFILLTFNLKPINSKVISDKIVQESSKLKTKKNSISYPNYQFFLKQYGKFLKDIDFLKLLNPNFNNDTLFVVMRFDELFYVSDFNIGLWNNNKQFYFIKRDTTNLNSYPDKFDYGRMILYQADKKYGMYSKFMIYLVDKWDLKGLKEERKKYPLLGGGNYLAVRILFYRNKCKINCFTFSDFFNIERDRNLFQGDPNFLKRVIDINHLPFSIDKEC